MKNNLSGSIVNVASIYGVVGNDFTIYENTDGMTSPAAYSAIKGGIINFTKYLASYFGSYGIRVNAVSPGGIFNHQNKTFVKQFEYKVPLKRMARPEEIAPSITFLLTDESTYITGHNLIVDGGWTSI
jgi:NAD(P)-dependent dehydrogenase (short-subunit alcohol dehydrogenase family)